MPTIPTRRALIALDIQQEYVEGVLPIRYPPLDRSIGNIVAALDGAESHDLPVAVVQHEYPRGAPAFAAGSTGWALHPTIRERVRPHWHRVAKRTASIFAGTDVEAWLRDQDVDTISIVGYMTNNCVIASAAAAEPLGVKVEVLSDATGAIDLSNQAGSVRAKDLHETLMVLLHSNFAAVSTTESWLRRMTAEMPPHTDSLIASAAAGRRSA